MLPSPCYVISDMHLGPSQSELERSVVEFLRSLQRRAASLVINGDLFDFWFEWRHVVPRGHFRLLATLADLRDTGTQLVMVGGNHDLWGGPELTQEVGLRFEPGEWRGDLAGWQAVVEHGHGLRSSEDRLYRVLLTVFRSRLAIRAFSMLHPDWAVRLARGTSQASRDMQTSDEGEGLRRVAHERLHREPGVELLVYGHSHVASLERVPGAGVYANAGSWLVEPTFLVVTPDAIELRRWRGSTQSDLLHSLDRRAEKALSKA
ncbi:MAG TPA: UDP-2,3-diacylglucosamine diphosphatase [Gemmatimonadaceae bacterium]|nr:UDP-2,3-diacylglucosamine diphosphatase [Gemmatimonadaceae bacterium]